MATVKIDKFGGMMPRTHPSLLQDGMAVEARNCRLKNGKLVPLREPSFVDELSHTVYLENGLESIGKAKSLYCWKHTMLDGSVRTDFLAFPGDVYFAHGNIADDVYDRVFVTGDTGVSWLDSSNTEHNNCPCVYLFDRDGGKIVTHCLCKDAMNAPRCSLYGDLKADGVRYAAFFMTWVDEYGYESPASDPSLNKNTSDGTFIDDTLTMNETCTVTFQPVYVPTGAKAVRLYMTNEGDETDNIQFVREFGSSELYNLTGEFNVSISSSMAEEAMPEIENAPIDLRDMTFVPGNFYVGRSKSKPHTVMFSDVDNPTNWPMAYQYDIRDNLVKLAVTSNTVFALTDGFPYVINGTTPESMSVTSIAGPAACVSERGVCVYKNAVFFVGNYGLFTIYNDADAGTVCQCVTEKMFTKEQWQELNPSSCVMGQFDGALHLFFTLKDKEHRSLIIDLNENAAALTEHDEATSCMCVDDRADEMYFVRNTEG